MNKNQARAILAGFISDFVKSLPESTKNVIAVCANTALDALHPAEPTAATPEPAAQ